MCITAIAVYIHTTLRSLTTNSGITLDLFRINEISIYTILVYVAYGMLFLAMLFLLNILIATSSRHYIEKRKRHSRRLLMAYLMVTAMYMTGAVSYFGFQKECENIRILTGRLAVERDLNLEMQLQAIERNIISDPLVRGLAGNPEYENIILNRLAERYFYNILPEYDIRITTCDMFDMIITEDYANPVGCYKYFKTS